MGAVCFQSNKTHADAEVSSQNIYTKIFFGTPSELPPNTLRPLRNLGRFSPVQSKEIQELGFKEYAYVQPSELLGDCIFPKNGAFAYLHTNDAQSLVYPIVEPGDGGAPQKPVTYQSPVYI